MDVQMAYLQEWEGHAKALLEICSMVRHKRVKEETKEETQGQETPNA